MSILHKFFARTGRCSVFSHKPEAAVSGIPLSKIYRFGVYGPMKPDAGDPDRRHFCEINLDTSAAGDGIVLARLHDPSDAVVIECLLNTGLEVSRGFVVPPFDDSDYREIEEESQS
ncbi:hypothetical protein [Ruficoccus sp. ZRK36]|uniref:hypothetical protein n=1 Tax=Ruficoccus sp. ZRK36 TaxID=2866311 RepID=UPI001C7362CC|nr:hypothetical protein [Ruficoccus sp. ZRK36]QYY35162.1 hypothetical protein K0V07_12755 [Ruficoccus sp. ZRK36]